LDVNFNVVGIFQSQVWHRFLSDNNYSTGGVP
jgi:hypothetical protein